MIEQCRWRGCLFAIDWGNEPTEGTTTYCLDLADWPLQPPRRQPATAPVPRPALLDELADAPIEDWPAGWEDRLLDQFYDGLPHADVGYPADDGIPHPHIWRAGRSVFDLERWYAERAPLAGYDRRVVGDYIDFLDTMP
jgi:hypothetical protein